jgi:hypothetical protein
VSSITRPALSPGREKPLRYSSASTCRYYGGAVRRAQAS